MSSAQWMSHLDEDQPQDSAFRADWFVNGVVCNGIKRFGGLMCTMLIIICVYTYMRESYRAVL